MTQLLQTCRSLTLMAVVLFGLGLSAMAQRSDKEAAKAAKVTADLYQIMLKKGQVATQVFDGLVVQNNQVFKDNKVAIEAVANNEDGEGLLNQLKTLGLTEGVAHKRIIFGYLPIDKIAELKTIPSLSFARPYYEPIHNTGSVTSQGDVALRANIARTTYGVTGAGVKVGVISDSYNKLNGAAAGVASGDLPNNVQVLLEPTSGGTDEGRAMAEIVHDVAPGADIAFSTANGGEPTFAQSILNLALAGCKVIVDDIIYLSEPFFQDGIVAQAANDVVDNRGVTYFSSAGNRVRASYQAPFKSGGNYQGYPTHDFGSGTVDNLQRISIPSGQSLRLVFQWDNPYQSVSGGTGATTDLDIYVLNPTTGAVITSSTNDQTNGGDPLEITGAVTNSSGSPRLVDVVIVKYAGPDPGLIKWVNFGGNNIVPEYATNSGASFGHNSSAGAISVGAAGYFATPAFNGAATATIEPFSSAGGTPILFNTDGSRINGITGVIRQKPEITAVDGGDNTFFGSDYEGNGKPNFFGTSAAAPHAAAVAALMKEKVPTITRNAILSALQSTALDMDDPLTPGFDTGFDFRTGFGFIQADRALQAISNTAPTVANAIPPQSATVGQAYTYTIPANTFTDAETPNSLTLSVTGLPPDLSFTAPATISGTPSTTVGSPFNVTVTAKDPGNLTASTTFAFTIAPAAPVATAPVAPTLPNLTATVGIAFSYVVPTFSGTTPITYTASGLPAGLSFDASSRTISGMPTTAQVSTVTITGTNSAGSGSGNFTITVNPAPVGGNFAISGVTTNGCAQLTPDSRQVTFTPQYSNSDGSAISFRTINESVPTTAAGPYSLRLYIDNPVVTLEATQSGKVATFSYNWLSFCNSNSRIGVAEQREQMLVTVLGNPVVGDRVELEIRGAQHESLRIQATDGQGRTVGETTIERAGQIERAAIELGRSTGMYLLRVNTPTQQQVIKLIRQ